MVARRGKRDRSASGNATPGSASNHAISTWRMAVDFANLGIAGTMVKSKHWATKHRRRLLAQLVALLQSKKNPAGILLNEIGNLSDLVQGQEREKINDVLKDAFYIAGASKHGSPLIFWSDGETLGAFRAEVSVRPLPTLEFNAQSKIDTWRKVERFEVTGATEHGRHSLQESVTEQPSEKAPRRALSKEPAMRAGDTWGRQGAPSSSGSATEQPLQAPAPYPEPAMPGMQPGASSAGSATEQPWQASPAATPAPTPEPGRPERS